MSAAPGVVAVSAEVAAAVQAGRPVVALESTIISHGLPRPRNLEVARELEAVVRDGGAVPATIGVIAGVPTVGVDAAGLEVLAAGDGVRKASVRDLPLAVAGGHHAATTVASTAYLAHRAGIAVFATGGIGGVHRGAGDTFDESADLVTLATTRLTVVCAGVKSILDVPGTLERLETLGVTVAGWRTTQFPGFYVADSGHVIDASLDGPDHAAATMAAAEALDLPGALLVAAPVPLAGQLDPAVHAAAIADGLAAAARDGVRGKAVTPYLLDRLRVLTGGASLEANLAAVRNNVAVGTEIAVAWARLRRG